MNTERNDYGVWLAVALRALSEPEIESANTTEARARILVLRPLITPANGRRRPAQAQYR